jgi:hypothetical protein
VWDPRAETRHRKTFATYPEAKAWRDDVRIAVRSGTARTQSKQTVGQAADALLEGMEGGTILDRSGKEYKPSTCRSYAVAVNNYLKRDPLARKPVTEVARADVQTTSTGSARRVSPQARSRTSSIRSASSSDEP